ncbi:MAG: hypothetical protein ABIH04_03900 [Planctomycetota bacterium]
MRCEKARKRLALLVGGDATYKEGESAKEHIITCQSCADEAEAYQQSLHTLRLLKDRTVSAGFWDGYNEEILHRIKTEPHRTYRPYHINSKQISTLFAAAATLLLGFMLVWPFIAGVPEAEVASPPLLERIDATPQRPSLPPSPAAEQGRTAGGQKSAPEEWFQPVRIPAPREI